MQAAVDFDWIKEQHGKRYTSALKKVREVIPDPLKGVETKKALEILLSLPATKFDQTVEIAVRLNVDPKQADQMVRGAVALPHGLGKTAKVVVFAKGEKAAEAQNAGADFVGAEDLVEKITGGWQDFSAVVATPDLMGVVSRLGKVLGPRGLMPNPKVGTVTFDVAKAVSELKKGRVEFRVEKAGIIHAPIGKLSFGLQKLSENLETVMEQIVRAKPSTAKAPYILSFYISTVMGPSVRVDESQYMKS
jgi:large subunit ribosomal protein L1